MRWQTAPERFVATDKPPVVWVVDDSAMERHLTVRSLGAGYVFEQFSDGMEVVERLAAAREQPDVVLLDWVMPGMTGDEVCRFVRSHPRIKDTPIILVTASRIETGDVVEGLASGADDYVARPFAPEELRARVDAAIRTKRNKDAAILERLRLVAVNRLGRALFAAGTNIASILDQLATTLGETLCDGCSILILPGRLPAVCVTRHRGGAQDELAKISTLADPGVHLFESSEQALAVLPAAYHGYIRACGMRSLAILPFPILMPIQGVITATRDGSSKPFEAEDIATVETCIEYAALAVQNSLSFEAERTARAQLHAVLEHAPIGLVVTDATSAITFANPAANKLIPGIAQTPDLAGVFQLARWASADGVALDSDRWEFGRARTPEQPARLELTMNRDEDTRTLSISSVPLEDGRGAIVGSVTAIEDISSERAIAAERLRISQFQEQLLGIVSHDLRNPLSAIITGTELVGKRAADRSDVVALVKRIGLGTTRMVRIIDQLLDVTRARLGSGLPIVRTRVDLVGLVKEVLNELELTHRTAKIELTAPSEVNGDWDPDRLSQVVANLVSNAVHYGKRDAPIKVAVSSSKQFATLTVTNEVRGEPVPQEQLASLFEPYRRSHRSERDHSTGLGLGLYIVHEIVRGHCGTITAESTIAGTVFRVELPRHSIDDCRG